MKRRGWRVALTVATIGLALVAVLAAFNWATVRDHAEAWWFQLTRETEMVARLTKAHSDQFGKTERRLSAQALVEAGSAPVQVREPGLEKMSRRAFLWTYGIPDGEVVYDFTLTRGSRGPKEFLAGFEGYLQTDAYAGYNLVFETGRVIHLGCWAHARRKFYDARAERPEFAELVLGAIQKLYRLEREAKEAGLTGERLVELRRREAKPLLVGIREILGLHRAEFLPKSGLAEAVEYTLGQWDSLVRYVDISQAPIDNNAAERSMRRVVLGRNNWLFVGHPDAGPRAAVILSLVETCRRLEVNPYEYLKCAIHELAKDPSRAAELTPRAWRADQLSRAEKPLAPPAG